MIAKHLFRKLSNLVARNHSLFSVLDSTMFRAVDYLRFLHSQAENEERTSNLSLEEEFIINKIPDLIVRNGPFAGMRYPGVQSVCSTIVPKLIGCYEKELHSVIELICSQQYNSVVDIGCAEGYYAVGLAMRLQNAQLFA